RARGPRLRGARVPVERVRRAGAGLARRDPQLLRPQLRRDVSDVREGRGAAGAGPVPRLRIAPARRRRARLALLPVPPREGRPRARLLPERRAAQGRGAAQGDRRRARGLTDARATPTRTGHALGGSSAGTTSGFGPESLGSARDRTGSRELVAH